MFNIYIYDYCFKRGFRKTARELLAEAEIPPDSTPPINARQGLLYEWWSVFWVLFQAKSNAQGGTEDAQLYNMHMRERHDANPPTRNNPSIPGAPSAVSSANPQQQRLPIPTGVPNGAAPVSGPSYGQPQHPQAGSPMFPMGAPPGPQVNGVIGSHPPTPASGPAPGPLPPGRPGGPQQQLYPMMQQQPPRQLNGPQPPSQQGPPSQPQQQRPPAGANPNMPFQSPTLAASSPNHGPGLPPPQQPGGPHPPMGNLGGPSPMMNRPLGMPPPNGGPPPQGMMMPPQGASMLQNGTPTQQFQPIPNNGRPQSRTNTPQMQGMTQQSPSMANRHLAISDDAVLAEFSRVPPQLVNQVKGEYELGTKDITQFTIQDKRKFLQFHQSRGRLHNASAGPSNPSLPQNQPARGPQQHQQPQPQQRGKRPSTSPGEEHDTLPRTESSPPDRKRIRRSPMEGNTGVKPGGSTSFPSTPQQGAAIPPPPPPQGQMGMGHLQQQGGPGNMQPGMMMMSRPMQPGPQGQMMVNGHIPPPMMQSQPMGQPMQGMGPQGNMGHPGSGIMQSQMGQNYRVPLNQVHTLQSQNAGSPAGPDQQFNPGMGPMSGPPGGPPFHGNRLMGPKPGPGGMMPPPSPAIISKDKDGKIDPSPAAGGQPQQPGPQNNGPPRSTPTPQMPTTSTPVGPPPQHPGNGGPQGPPSQQQNPGGPTPSPMPSNLMSGGPGSGGPMSSLSNPLGLDNSIDGMDMFATPNFDMDFQAGFDFARDFAPWFNPEEGMQLGAETGQ